MDIKDSLLPEIQLKPKINLSPWTWNNLKIPILNKNPEKTKSTSEKKTIKIQKETESLHLKTIKEQPQQEREKMKERLKIKKQQSKATRYSEQLNQYTTITQTVQPRLDSQRYRLRSKVQRLNKTIELAKSEQPNSIQKPQQKRIRFLDDKNNMEKYLKSNLTRIGWSQSNKHSSNQAHLLWSNIDKTSDHFELKDGQFYNHINGSHHLTNKDKLHERLNGKQYYPKSFLIPNQYESFAKENNKIAVKRMLKILAGEIDAYVNSGSTQAELMQVTLWQIYQSSILKLGNEQTTILFKLCMYLQEIRRQDVHNHYFQKFQGYRPVNLNHKQHFYDILIQKSFAYLQNNKIEFLRVDYQHIDYRLLILILHYHCLFSQYDPTYPDETSLWIVKPIASSRGAGISIVKALREYCINPQNMWNEFKNRKKYENKIIQRYVTNPYILQKPQEFAKRKFDIRQWVLVASHKGKPIVYKYHTGYCRFSHEQFSLNKLSNEIHLTNYSIFKTIEESNKIPSIMMLDDLFSLASSDLRNKYNQQVNHIITDSILSYSQIKYQQGCFQLFGFDFLIDSQEKVILLEVNLNPACNAQRHPKLQQQSQQMTKTMISLITESKPTDKWIKLYGANNTIDSSSQADESKLYGAEEMVIKPYYKYQLTDDESLLAYIRLKNRVMSRMFYLVQRYQYRGVFNLLQNREFNAESEQESLKDLIHFIEQKSVSNI